MPTRDLRFTALLMTLGAVSGCSAPSGPSTSADAPSSREAFGSGPVPLCQAGCIEPDPSPSSPGYFLGSAVDPVPCFDGVYTDADDDGVGDFCERNLAAAFAPEFRTWSLDNTAGEPYWAGQPGPNQTVRIVYLLAYYRDEGSPSQLCNLPPPFWHPSCEGHNGDSEAVMLELKFNASTSHWLLERAWLSQHGTAVEYQGKGTTTTPHGTVKLQYPHKAQGYPRVWASHGKHANYATQAECDTGGSFSTDTCDHANTSWRVTTSAAYDIGTRSNRLIDCVESRNPSHLYYGAGRTECLWTIAPGWPITDRFAGWIPDSVGGARSTHYSLVLSEFGF